MTMNPCLDVVLLTSYLELYCLYQDDLLGPGVGIDHQCWVIYEAFNCTVTHIWYDYNWDCSDRIDTSMQLFREHFRRSPYHIDIDLCGLSDGSGDGSDEWDYSSTPPNDGTTVGSTAPTYPPWTRRPRTTRKPTTTKTPRTTTKTTTTTTTKRPTTTRKPTTTTTTTTTTTKLPQTTRKPTTTTTKRPTTTKPTTTTTTTTTKRPTTTRKPTTTTTTTTTTTKLPQTTRKPTTTTTKRPTTTKPTTTTTTTTTKRLTTERFTTTYHPPTRASSTPPPSPISTASDTGDVTRVEPTMRELGVDPGLIVGCTAGGVLLILILFGYLVSLFIRRRNGNDVNRPTLPVPEMVRSISQPGPHGYNPHIGGDYSVYPTQIKVKIPAQDIGESGSHGSALSSNNRSSGFSSCSYMDTENARGSLFIINGQRGQNDSLRTDRHAPSGSNVYANSGSRRDSALVVGKHRHLGDLLSTNGAHAPRSSSGGYMNASTATTGNGLNNHQFTRKSLGSGDDRTSIASGHYELPRSSAREEGEYDQLTRSPSGNMTENVYEEIGEVDGHGNPSYINHSENYLDPVSRKKSGDYFTRLNMPPQYINGQSDEHEYAGLRSDARQPEKECHMTRDKF